MESNNSNTKRIIYILSEWFGPYQNVGAVKFTKIAKYLSRKEDCIVYVIARENEGNIDTFLLHDIDEIKGNGGYVYHVDTGRRNKKGHSNALIKKAFRVLKMRFQKQLAKRKNPDQLYISSKLAEAESYVKGGLFIIERENMPKPDVIISTYDDWGGNLLGKRLKEEYGDSVLWISDFRDPVGGEIATNLKKICNDYSVDVTKVSDITTVSTPSLAKDIVFAEGVEAIVAPIGFDYEDYRSIEENRTLSFSYMGSFYSKYQSVKPILKVLKELIKEGEIGANEILFNYAGSYGERFLSEFEDEDMAYALVDWGVLTRKQSLLIQGSSDFLVTSVRNSEGYEGDIAGKTLEYIGVKKPIIAVVIGDKKDSDIKQLIIKGNCGTYYEQANDEEDHKLLKQYILDVYNKKKSGQKVECDTNYEYVSKYDLKNVAETYYELMH